MRLQDKPKPKIMKRSIAILPVLLMLHFSSATFAQGKLGVFVGAGTMFYSGDLQEFIWPQPLTMRWTANAGLHWQINRRWGLQLNYTVGEVIGNDALATTEWRRQRNLSFQSFVHEIGLRGTFDILPNNRWRVLPYLTAGVGALHFNPKNAGPTLEAPHSEAGTFSNWNVSFPTGLGVKYTINCQWALKGELNYHWTLTDHLDGISARGNPKLKDGFFDVNVGVVFFFLGCGNTKKGGLIEDCDRLYKDVDMDKLMDKYGQ